MPKVSLTGQSTERTDTRVLQAIYSFDPAALPVYVGQQMDVFIEALLPAHPHNAHQRACRDCASAMEDPRCSAWP